MIKQSTKKKKYGAVDRELSLLIILGLAFFHILTLILNIYFFTHFIMNGDMIGWALIILPWICFIPADIILIKQHFFGRLFINYLFYDDGIHCSGLGWGKFTVPWNTIRTYGYADNSNKGINFRFFYFSQDSNEQLTNIRSALEIRKDRLILQYRKDAWEAAKEFMPIDMKRNLEDCLRHDRGGFFRR